MENKKVYLPYEYIARKAVAACIESGQCFVVYRAVDKYYKKVRETISDEGLQVSVEGYSSGEINRFLAKMERNFYAISASLCQEAFAYVPKSSQKERFVKTAGDLLLETDKNVREILNRPELLSILGASKDEELNKKNTINLLNHEQQEIVAKKLKGIEEEAIGAKKAADIKHMDSFKALRDFRKFTQNNTQNIQFKK